MFQAIVTKYYGPTNTRGSRIKATAAAGSVTVSYNCGLSQGDNHKAAAEALARKFGWVGTYARGGMPCEGGDVFVCIDRADTFTIAREA